MGDQADPGQAELEPLQAIPTGAFGRRCSRVLGKGAAIRTLSTELQWLSRLWYGGSLHAPSDLAPEPTKLRTA